MRRGRTEPHYSIPGHLAHSPASPVWAVSEEATRLTEANQAIQIFRRSDFGANDIVTPKCQLVLSSLSLAGSFSGSSSSGSSAALWTQAREWALDRDAKDVLCWSFLVEARFQFSVCSVQFSVDDKKIAESLERVEIAIERRVPLAPPVPSTKETPGQPEHRHSQWHPRPSDVGSRGPRIRLENRPRLRLRPVPHRPAARTSPTAPAARQRTRRH